MSVAAAETRLTHEPAVPDEMPDGIAPRGVALSVALHLVLGTIFILGLPRLFDSPMPEEMPVAVQLVTIAPDTRATRPNPNQPRPDAKPEIPDAETPVETVHDAVDSLERSVKSAFPEARRVVGHAEPAGAEGGQ